MILLNDTNNSHTLNKAGNNDLPNESSNSNLWKQALEKNGLYIALNKFGVIEGNQRPQEVLVSSELKTSIKSENDKILNSVSPKDSLRTTSFKEPQTGFLENNYLVNMGNKSDTQLSLLNQTFLNQSFINKLTTTKDTTVINTFKDFTYSLQWSNKNTMVTLVNSNLEVWIRDSSLTSTKLSDILRSIKESMAELGANLSKVTINGRVTFHREK